MGHQKELLSGFSRCFERIFLLLFSFDNPFSHFVGVNAHHPRPYGVWDLFEFTTIPIGERNATSMVIQFRRYWNLLATYLKPQWTRVILLTVLLFGSIGLQLVNPQIIRYFIDTTQAGGSPGTLFIV